MTKVSIIIPCFNLGEYVVEALDSVLKQTYQDFEVIIVNDGSTDELTNNILDSLNRPKTRVLKTVNQGLPAARNYGISKTNSEYICCLDADDKYHPQFLEKAVAALEEDYKHELGMVTSWIQTFGQKDEIWKPEQYNPFKLAFENMLHVASLFRRECWDVVGGYATNLEGYQDWNFWLSIVSKGYKWISIPETLFNYRIRENSMVTGSNKKRGVLFDTIIENNKPFYIENLKPILIEFKNSYDQLEQRLHDALSDRDQKWALVEEMKEKYQELQKDRDQKWALVEEMKEKYKELQNTIGNKPDVE